MGETFLRLFAWLYLVVKGQSVEYSKFCMQACACAHMHPPPHTHSVGFFSPMFRVETNIHVQSLEILGGTVPSASMLAPAWLQAENGAEKS